MTPELNVLVLAALLQVVQYLLFSVPANLELGTKRTLSSRDRPIDLSAECSPTTARLGRALQNHFESLILYGIAAIAITLSEKSSPLTAVCAHTYLIARILYVPAYASGAVPWRSIIWFFGFGATLAMLLAALLL
ncbi:MAG: MAPEG family protein [Pseudomonadota bacterium]